jgi:hypothetical protein
MVYSSLDSYILQIHSIEIVRVLDSLISFAERIMPLILLDEDASEWWFHPSLLIHRQHWFRLAHHALKLAYLARHALKPDGHSSSPRLSRTGSGADQGAYPEVEEWPDWDRLRESAERALDVFGAFSKTTHVYDVNAPPAAALSTSVSAAEDGSAAAETD